MATYYLASYRAMAIHFQNTTSSIKIWIEKVLQSHMVKIIQTLWCVAHVIPSNTELEWINERWIKLKSCEWIDANTIWTYFFAVNTQSSVFGKRVFAIIFKSTVFKKDIHCGGGVVVLNDTTSIFNVKHKKIHTLWTTVQRRERKHVCTEQANHAKYYRPRIFSLFIYMK